MPLKSVCLSVAGVALEGESDSPTVLLKDVSGRTVLAVPVGAFEASAIIIEVEGLHPPRPLTHDILAEFFIRHAFRLDCFELYARDEDGYFGRLRYKKGFRRLSMEVRPSDGIALALKLGAPITAVGELADVMETSELRSEFTPFSTDSVLFLNAERTSVRI